MSEEEIEDKAKEWTETDMIEYLEKKVEELKKQISEFNLCGNTVAKSTYNEVVNENAILKAGISKMEITTTELKSQIEKMKHCMTCKHNQDSKYYCRCDLGLKEQCNCIDNLNRDKWELAE